MSSLLGQECVAFTEGGIDTTPQQGFEKLDVKNTGKLVTCTLQIKSFANPASTEKNSNSFQQQQQKNLEEQISKLQRQLKNLTGS